MKVLNITDKQQNTLIRTLESTVAELHTEIAHTDDKRVKNELREQREDLYEVLDSLKKHGNPDISEGDL